MVGDGSTYNFREKSLAEISATSFIIIYTVYGYSFTFSDTYG